MTLLVKKKKLTSPKLSLNWWSPVLILLVKLEWYVYKCEASMYYVFHFIKKGFVSFFFPTLVIEERLVFARKSGKKPFFTGNGLIITATPLNSRGLWKHSVDCGKCAMIFGQVHMGFL